MSPQDRDRIMPVLVASQPVLAGMLMGPLAGVAVGLLLVTFGANTGNLADVMLNMKPNDLATKLHSIPIPAIH